MKKNLIIEYDDIRIVASGEAKDDLFGEIILRISELDKKKIGNITVFKDGKVMQDEDS